MKKQYAASMIELIIFILLAAISASILIPLLLALRNVSSFHHHSQALSLAQQRMELILKQRRTLGFAAFIDPCQGNAYAITCPSQPCICNVINASGTSASPPGFTVVSSIITNGNYKIITVTVSDESSVALRTEVANY